MKSLRPYRQLYNKQYRLLYKGLCVGFCLLAMHSVADDNKVATPKVADKPTATSNVLKLDDVIVKGNRFKHEAFNVNNMEGSTGSKSALPLLETPVTVNVINSELIDLRGASSLNKIVGYVAGITPETRGGGAGRYDQLTIRGHDPKFTSYFNGMKLMYNGSWLALQIDPFILDRVEVLKGPASVLYGANPPGGLINQVSKTPLDYDETKILLKGGSQKLGEIAIDNNYIFAEDSQQGVRARTLLKFTRRDTQPRLTERQRYLIAPSLEWQFSDTGRIILRALYQRDPAAGGYGMQPRYGTLSPHPSGFKVPKNFYDGDKNFEVFDRKQMAFGYDATYAFNKHIALTQKANIMHNTLALENIGNNFSPLVKIKPNDPYRFGLQRYLLKSDERLDFITVDNQLSLNFDTGPFEHHLLLGYDFQDTGSSRYTGGGLITGALLDISQPNNDLLTNRQALLLKLSEIRYVKTSSFQHGLYAQDQIKLNNLTLMYSARFDRTKVEQIIRRADTNTLINQGRFEEQELTQRLGLLYLFDVGIAPFVSISQSFEPSVDLDKNGNKFDPTTGQQLEYGVKYESALDNYAATLSIYNLKQDNVIVTDPESPADKTSIPYLKTRGFEADFRARLFEDVQWRIAFSKLNMRQKNPKSPKEDGKTPVAVADTNLSSWLSYGHIDGFLAGVGLRYVGKSQGNKFNDFQVDPYQVYDAAMSYAFRVSHTSVRTSFSVSNLLDRYYVASCYNSDVCWIGSQRSFDLGVEATF